MLASCGGEEGRGELFVWDVQSGECVQAFAGHPGVVYAIAWDPCGDLLVSGGSDGMLRWWDVQSGECVQVRKAHQGTIRSLRSSPDGRRLASCGDDGAITIWDLQSGDQLRTLRRDRPYERLNIAAIKGLTEAQKATLQALGAIESSPAGGSRKAP
jgi:WD40 repeat protein